MKILRLHFTNLNSLRGKWSIDFTDPAFQNNGVFLISGPTGSGKTTILDAISLALFGRTPRLTSITTKTNEIMSHGCFECSSELEFEVDSGTYRISWMQRRANSKLDGKLQQPKHELINSKNFEVLATKIREVAEKVEQLLGMDYIRFTRSILLAQGAFSSFLQADEADKSDILEQITGTNIYSEISIKAYEKLKEQKQSLNERLQQLDQLDILSDEDLANLKKQLVEIELELEISEKNRRELNSKIVQIKSLENLEERRKSCQNDLKNIEEQNILDEKKRAVFEAATKFKSIEPLYQEYIRQKEALDRKQLALSSSLSRLEKHRHEFSEMSKTQKILKDSLDSSRSIKFEQESIWEQVEVFDKKIEQLGLGLKTLSLQLNKKQEKFEEIDFKKNQLLAKQKIIECQIAQNRKDLMHFEKFSEIFENIDRFRDLYNQLSISEAELARLSEEKNEEITRIDSLNKDLSSLLEQKSKMITQTNELESSVSSIMKELESLDLFKFDLALVINGTIIESYTPKLKTFSNLYHEHFSLSSDLDEKRKDFERINEQLELSRNAADQIKLEIENLEKQLEGQRIQLIFKELREQLKDGVACSLCGSESHDLSKLRPSPVYKDVSAIHLARKKWEDHRILIEQLQLELSKLEATLKVLNGRKEGVLVSLRSLQKEFSGAFIAFDEQDFESSRAISFLAGLERKLLEAAKDIHDWREFNSQLGSKRREAENLSLRMESIGSATGELRERVSKKEEQLASCSERIRKTKSQLLTEFIGGFSSVDFQSIEVEYKNYQARIKDISSLSSSFDSIFESLKIYESEGYSLKSDIELILGEIKEFEAQNSQVNKQRFILFQDKSLKEEKQKVHLQLEHAEQAFVENNLELTRVIERINHETSLGAELNKDISLSLSVTNLAKEKLEENIRLSGFIDIEDFKRAYISEKEFDSYNEYFRNHDELKKKLIYEVNLINEQISQLGSLDVFRREELESQYKALNAAYTELSNDRGALYERLRVQEGLREKRSSLFEMIIKEKQSLQKWQDLHEMIGSSDGRKYRVFAQSLTFERMLKIANTQLMKMTDRYLLTQNPSSRLSLEVIDNYQGGVRRGVKNLSGGEGFIVSLALALALSRMSSKRSRMDSLFLDEGFGTLDDKALETALEALSSLTMEGKLVGLISHVSSLKESIPVQILVESSSTNGRSQLRGPGCYSGT